MPKIERPKLDRKRWGRGEWDQEPSDLETWVDPETGFRCLVIRNHGGAWCGYVGVGKTHPWYGVPYNGEPGQDGSRYDANGDRRPGVSPEEEIAVHGGLTYSGDRDGYYDPAPDEPSGLHFFGFDCSHCTDISPGYELLGGFRWNGKEAYRTIKYAKSETAKLALQLAGVKS